MTDKGEVYERKDGLYDWRVRSKENGQVVASSAGQGFDHKDDAFEAGRREFPVVEFEEVR